MDALRRQALLHLVGCGAVRIDAPAFGVPLPFTVRLDLVECVPVLRQAVLRALEAMLRSRHLPDALAAAPNGCRALVALLADRLNLPFVFPTVASTSDHAAIVPYGPVAQGMDVCVVHEYLRNRNPVERMGNALRAAGCRVTCVVAVLEADRDGETFAWCRASKIPYLPLLSFADIFLELRTNAQFSQLVAADVLAAAEKHYLAPRNSMLPSP